MCCYANKTPWRARSPRVAQASNDRDCSYRLAGTRASAAARARTRRAWTQRRRGSSLVEFALVSLVLYLLLAAIVTFGQALFVAQGIQQAATVAAREIALLPLPADASFEELLASGAFQSVYSDDYLVFDLDELGTNQDFFRDIVPSWPTLNQQLAPFMVVDRPDLDGDGTPDRRFLRYPGALLIDGSTPTGYTVGVPIVMSRAVSGTSGGAQGAETIRWVPVVEEVDTEDDPDSDQGDNPDPFRLSSSQRGLVALRINYPFQAAALGSYRANPAGVFEPNGVNPNAALDEEVVELNPAERPGALSGAALESGGRYAGPYGGQYGLGALGAQGSAELTGGRPIRPFRRVITGQAAFRREVFE